MPTWRSQFPDIISPNICNILKRAEKKFLKRGKKPLQSKQWSLFISETIYFPKGNRDLMDLADLIPKSNSSYRQNPTG